MNDTTTLVDRYLDDLARMLTALPPTERADALGSVREHLDDAIADLGRPATDDDVTAILGRLGTPADVATALLEDTPPTPAAPPTTPAYAPTAAPAPVHLPGDSSAALALTLGVLAILVPFLGLAAAIAAIVLARRARHLGTRNEGTRTAGLVLGVVAFVGQALVILGLAGFFLMFTDGTVEHGSDVSVAAVGTTVPSP